MDELALLLGASTLRDRSCDEKNQLTEKGDEDDKEDDEYEDAEDDEDDGSDDEANSALSPTPDDAA